MSAPIADAAAEGARTAPVRERTSVVIGVAACLALLAGIAYLIADHRTRAVNANATFAAWFEARELPFDLAPRESVVSPWHEEILVLASSSATPEPPRIVPPKPVDPKAQGETPFDWSAVPLGERDQPPLEVVVMRWPVDTAPAEIDKAMSSAPELRGDFGSIPRQGGRRTVERGTLAWGEFECLFVHEREFEAGGTFRDALRVNLSRPGAPLLFLARWPRGTPAAKARVEELLAALVPRA